jgi:hypothetical protein
MFEASDAPLRRWFVGIHQLLSFTRSNLQAINKTFSIKPL